MQLEFKKQNGLYEVEFEVTGNFNLHLERKNYGRVELYQKTSSETNYTSSPSYSTNGDAVINLDFSMGIYPKFVKIISYTEVEKAIVTMEGESGGSGAGGAKIVPLIEQCRVYWQNTMMGSHVEVRVPDENGQFINSPQARGYLVVESPNLYLPTSSTNNHTWFWDNEIGGFRTEVFEAYETFSFSYIEGI